MVQERFSKAGFKLLGDYDCANKRVKARCGCGVVFYPLPKLVFDGSTTSCGCKNKIINKKVRIRQNGPILTVKEINNRLSKMDSRLKMIGKFNGVEYKSLFQCACGNKKEFQCDSIIRSIGKHGPQ